ncbi:IMP dehydrogenase [Candidatus Geothermarchaeota archaeon ex4572_27]|nr:MAG: IMP dehydrogenase [Candidatus Geothermarchaeota archaeon ex4572_27]
MGIFLDKLLKSDVVYTFYDVILLPGKSHVEPREVDLRTKASKNHRINIPFVSSPMDTVTGADLAIALARQGGLGILHRNCTVEEQVEMAMKVKRAESTIIRDVIVVRPDVSVGEAIRIMREHDIHGLPVVDDGNRLVGIVTWRDVRYSDPNLKVRDVMTGRDQLVVATEEISIEEAKRLMQKHRIEKLPIIDDGWKLKGLMTIKDLELRGRYPMASRDEEGRLLVGAAVSPYDLERAKKLDKYADILVIDVAHFHNENVIKATKKIVESVSADVIVGNLGTREAVLDVMTRLEGVCGLRVGIGSGSICTTGLVTRVAAPTLYATAQAADALEEIGAMGEIPIIADGGIKNAGDIALALAAGASAVMMGNIFAGTRESPGRLIAIEGKYYKEYYGMGSARARSKRMALDRYSMPSKDIEEGVEGWVPYRGTVEDVVRELVAGLQAAMGYVGARNIREMWQKGRFGILLPHGTQEIRPHNIIYTPSGQTVT